MTRSEDGNPPHMLMPDLKLTEHLSSDENHFMKAA